MLSWGYNEYGQLGLGHNTGVSKPNQLEFFKPGSRITYVGCGANHSSALLGINHNYFL